MLSFCIWHHFYGAGGPLHEQCTTTYATSKYDVRRFSHPQVHTDNFVEDIQRKLSLGTYHTSFTMSYQRRVCVTKARLDIQPSLITVNS
jgi:hypothetical protein